MINGYITVLLDALNRLLGYLIVHLKMLDTTIYLSSV